MLNISPSLLELTVMLERSRRLIRIGKSFTFMRLLSDVRILSGNYLFRCILRCIYKCKWQQRKQRTHKYIYIYI